MDAAASRSGAAMIRTLALILAASPAAAQEVHNWGASSARLVAGDPPRVECVNRLTGGHDMVLRFGLQLGAMVVAVTVDHGPGDEPDRYTVTPPDGWFAVPPYLDVQEGKTGLILLYPMDGALMG